nr:hypothetical protein [Klebsiella pneumoniae]
MTFIIYSLLFFVMVFGNYYVCKRIGVTENPYKYRTMDGLRGICATLVIFHHFFWRGGSSDDFFWSTDYLSAKEGANKQVISSQADSLIKISRIWADFFPANTSNQPI